ncbi:MAG: hypothetical protein AAGG72_05895 [Pseudomonadota bacterium]
MDIRDPIHLKNRTRDLYTARTLAQGITFTVTWSKLAGFAKSKMVAGTVLIPLFGTILLFNDATVQFVSLDERVLRAMGLEPSEQLFSLNMLYFTYFGLCSLGFGALVFNVFCPREVKNYPQIDDYIANAEQRASPAGTTKMLRDLLATYWEAYNVIGFIRFHSFMTDQNKAWKQFEREYRRWEKSVHVSANIYTSFLDMEERVFEDVEMPEGAWKSFNEYVKRKISWDQTVEPSEVVPAWVPYAYGVLSGMVRVSMLRGDKFDKGLRDVAFVHHIVLDYTAPGARLFTVIAFFVGGALLFVPTLRTFWLLLSNLPVWSMLAA